MQRRYFIKKLKTHPNIGSDGEVFQGKRWGMKTRTFKKTSAEMTRVLHERCNKKENYTHAGFKWMTSQHIVKEPARMTAWLVETQTKLLFLWRRSLLRQHISDLVNHLDGSRAHASSHAEAASIAKVTVKLKTGRFLVHQLERILKARSHAAAYYRTVPSATFYYEDAIESSGDYNQTWSSILTFLGAPDVALSIITDSVVIHTNKPILYSVSNAQQVRHSMRQICSTKKGLRYGNTCDELGWGLAGHSNTKEKL